MNEPYNKIINHHCEQTTVIDERGIAHSEPITQEIIKFASHLAETASKLNLQIEKKLSPFMLPTSNMQIGQFATNEEKSPRAYPPFFDELRCQLQRISASLQNIENAMSRTAL